MKGAKGAEYNMWLKKTELIKLLNDKGKMLMEEVLVFSTQELQGWEDGKGVRDAAQNQPIQELFSRQPLKVKEVT